MTINLIDPADESPPLTAMEEMHETKDVFDTGDPGFDWLMFVGAFVLIALGFGAVWALLTIVDYLRAYA